MAIAKKVTINDVAHAAGVSVATVSLVLSGKGRISMATGERVNQAIEALGFVRNRQAASLRGAQTGVIGLIVGDLSAPFYTELTAGLIESLESQGKMVFLTQGGGKGEHMLQRFDTLVSQGVDGVVIAGAVDKASELRDKAEESRVPLVFASRASYLEDVDLIRPDNMQAAQMLTEHLIHRGHQRIAWLGGQSTSLTRAERVGGYCATLFKYNLPFHSEWVVECESSQRQAAESFSHLLRHNPTITAVVCYNNVVAMGAWLGMLRSGWQSGDESLASYYEQRVALAAFAEVPENALEDAPMSWVITPAREMGHSVAARMLERIDSGKNAVKNQIMPPRLVSTK
ncbi:Mal regulon transcriptional regulator MalI [Pluralibacter sp.]|uniref:Mal regulon transcriptional regulator MalI n=1 Tax=Pluralibacter sp. TaxID=1920032 RepID=UPI0025EAE8C5|nr:Mal regulon transcriptional regulator MalI [Pluralibacter sp.]MBV8041585.1 Mal regulon transcriptional regulator MalI [Pluralibacter sp.]